MEIKSLVIAGGWTAEWRIRPPETMKHAVPLPIAGLSQIARKLIMISGVRANGTHVEGLMTRILMVPTFSYSRRRGENTSTFSLGSGRFSSSGISMSNISSNSQYSGAISGKGESGTLRSSRTKFLDEYRITDMKSRQLSNGFVQVPSLTLEETWKGNDSFDDGKDENPGKGTYSDGFSHERKTPYQGSSSKLEMMQEPIMYADNKSPKLKATDPRIL
ncbi:hypothetical protein NC653_033888 [Populus alba x Populus x berolinensis]|uniref:Uncharacterized protein n=2 Tax=Populus TaxID=3689 RepID=A0A4U5LQG8_POPAL|nr:hypothetical protein NC653_033888 [Populus alba x Populus x berolinensis]TKR58180.1 hypothetical protein D5086_0000328470 [Populus alba]